MPRRMTATAQRLADLAYRQVKMGCKRVQQAGFSHAGVASQHTQLAAKRLMQRSDPLAGSGAAAQHRDGGGTVDLVQVVRRVKVALVQHHQHLTALQHGDGADAVDQVGIRHRNGSRGNDHQLIHVGGGGPLELTAARLDALHQTFSAAKLLHLYPVAYEGAHALLAELTTGTALQYLRPGVHIIEAAQGFFNPAPAQKLITCESVATPLIRAYTVTAVPGFPSKS